MDWITKTTEKIESGRKKSPDISNGSQDLSIGGMATEKKRQVSLAERHCVEITRTPDVTSLTISNVSAVTEPRVLL